MTREEIITAVKAYTNNDTTEITTVCQNHIDLIQDNEICSNIYGHDFSFLTEYSEINTSPTYSTGTITVTQDSTTVTGDSTVWTSTHVGWLLKVTGDDEYYEISTIDTGTQTITLTSAYIGTTDASATYTLYKVYYSLPSDFKKMKWVKQIVTPQMVLPIRELTMVQNYTDEFDSSGNISAYILSGLDASNVPQIRFYPIQTSRKRVYICYVKSLPTLNGTGLSSKIPSKWHMLFVYKLNEIIFDMNSMPNRAAKEERKFDRMLSAFIKEVKSISKDSIDTMQKQFLTTTLAHPVLDSSHYSNY
jgi:hypothetical protein